MPYKPFGTTSKARNVVPNKIFQAMIFKTPVVVSSARPLLRVIEDAQCGVAFTAGDPRSFAQAVLRLRDEGTRRELGENGKRAVDDRYNWTSTAQALLKIYREPRGE